LIDVFEKDSEIMLPPSWKTEVQETVKEEAHRESEKREAADRDQTAIVAAALTAINNQLEAHNQRQDRTEKPKRWFDIATAGFVFATAVFTGLAWWVFRGQLDEMKKAYGPLEQQAKIATDSLIAANRAWMAPSRAELDDAAIETGDLNFTIYYGYVGREPALGFVAQQEINTVAAPTLPDQSLYSIFPKNTITDICEITRASDGAGTAYPSGLGDQRYTIFAKADPTEMPNIQAVIKRTRAIFIHGCFAYFTFGIERKSEFCFLRLPIVYSDPNKIGFKFVRCPYGNDTHEPKTKSSDQKT